MPFWLKLLEVLRRIQKDAEAPETVEEENQLWKIGAFVCVGTSSGLRGYEGFYLDLAGLWENIHHGRDGSVPPNLNRSTILSKSACRSLPHVAICLLGNFKGKDGINYHTVNVASKSQTGFPTRWWVEKLVVVCESEGRTHGPAFTTARGDLVDPGDYDVLFSR